MQESLSAEHSSKLLGDSLKQLLDGSGVSNKGGRHLESTWRDVTHSGLDVVGDPLNEVAAVLVLDIEHLLINFLKTHQKHFKNVPRGGWRDFEGAGPMKNLGQIMRMKSMSSRDTLGAKSAPPGTLSPQNLPHLGHFYRRMCPTWGTLRDSAGHPWPRPCICLCVLATVLVQYTGPGGFMGYGDLWGFIFTWFIYNKSMLGFMGIYGDLYHPRATHKSPLIPINPHKSDQIYGDLWGFISPGSYP